MKQSASKAGGPSLITRVYRRALRTRAVGRPWSAALRAVGLGDASRRASQRSGSMPAVVPFRLAWPGGRPPVEGRMFSGDGHDHIVQLVWCHGIGRFEYPFPHLFAAAVRDADVVLDVGANSGLYAVLAARASPTGTVLSYEPFPPARAWLERNVRLNGAADRVRSVPAALGAEPGTAELFVPAKDHGETLETSASLNREFRPAHSEVLKVSVRRADDDVAPLAPRRVSVLRVDVEGAEPLVLAGAAGVLRDHRPLVMIEVLSDRAAVELPAVRCVAGPPNQPWFPREQRDRVDRLFAAVGVAWAGTAA